MTDSPDPETCYKLKQTPFKGLGLFATRPIPPGTTILSDQPLMPILRPSHLYTISDLEAAFSTLSSTEQTAVLSLHHDPSASTPPLLQVFKNNAFGDGQKTWLHENVCRINHSCIPNATTVLDPDVPGEVQVIAEREIKEGEEVTISYNNDMFEVCTAAERAALLRRQYGFSCDCEVCGSEENRGASDAKRRMIGEVRGLLDGLEVSDEARVVFEQWRNGQLSEDGLMSIGQEELCLEQKAGKKDMTHQERLTSHLLLAHLREAEGLEASNIAQNWMRAAEALLAQMTEMPYELVILPWALNVRVWMEKALSIMNKVRSPWDHEAQELRLAWAKMRETACLKVALQFLDGQKEALLKEGMRHEDAYALLIAPGGKLRVLSKEDFDLAKEDSAKSGSSIAPETASAIPGRIALCWRNSSKATKCGIAATCLAPVAAYWMLAAS